MALARFPPPLSPLVCVIRPLIDAALDLMTDTFIKICGLSGINTTFTTGIETRLGPIPEKNVREN